VYPFGITRSTAMFAKAVFLLTFSSVFAHVSDHWAF
jgi:hypothetical protein